jgi:transcriptional regulator with XRE-family HTH domain
MDPTTHPLRAALARRLRELREEEWPDARITQRMLAKLMGRSEATISSWENPEHSAVPPPEHLEIYALVFSTRKSLRDRALRLVDDHELTESEAARRVELRTELHDLHVRTTGAPASGSNLLAFNDGFDITIVCGELPDELRNFRYSDRDDPDYVELYGWADIDSLLEMYGHLRALNPDSTVNRRLSPDMNDDDYTSHLVVLGGPDLNDLTEDAQKLIKMPVELRGDWEGETKPHFEADGENHAPVLDLEEGRARLRSDVALFYRGLNPYNTKRTITLCYGMYNLGTYGAVRALTDTRFRDRNSAHVLSHLSGSSGYGLLSRVVVRKAKAVTPDWTLESTRLFEWTNEAP